MANDPSLALREKVVILLRDTSALTNIVPEERVFGEQPGAMPDRPFVRYGVDDVVPLRPSCWDGAEVNFPVHSFSAEKFTDQVRGMNAAIAAELDGQVIDLGGGMKAVIIWQGSQVLRDGADPNAWHGISRFSARI